MRDDPRLRKDDGAELRVEHHSRPSHRRLRLGSVGRIWQLIGLALEVRRERRKLLGMDDRALKDVGFNRGDAYAEASRSFWDLPVDRLRR